MRRPLRQGNSQACVVVSLSPTVGMKKKKERLTSMYKQSLSEKLVIMVVMNG